MSNPKITGLTSDDSGFSVSFPNGFDSDPLIELKQLEIDCDGGDLIYSSLEACANYILQHIDELKSRKQYEFNVCDFTDENGVANCTIKDGKIEKYFKG